jgi:hypothetical protein
MAIKSSFVSTVEQIVKLNDTNIQTLTGLNQIVRSDLSEIEITVFNANDQPVTISLPTVGFLKAEIERINQNLKTLSSIESKGAIVQPANNVFRKIILADLNKEPNTVGQLNAVSTFSTQSNSFFDALLNPLLNVEINLEGQIEDDVREVLSRRYIIKFDEDATGATTAQAQTSINLFNEQFKGRTNITITELETWILNTPGIVTLKNGSKINFDEQLFNLDPNSLKYDGLFTITGTEEDRVNRKLWYFFDTLTYFDIATGEQKTLAVDDQLIINTDFSSTRFKIVEISTAASNIRVRLIILEGFEPVPIAITGGLKYYSPVVTTKKVKISVSFDEYNVIFVKPVNTDNFLVARDWSNGTAFFTNELRLSSSANTGENGTILTDYYINSVYDYGKVLQDLVELKIPLIYSLIPNSPTLNVDNFVVRQTNKNITDTPDSEKLKLLHSQANTLRSKLDQLNETLKQKRDQLVKTRFKNDADKIKVQNEISKLIGDQEQTTRNLQAVTNQIVSQDNLTAEINPEYRIQGFWSIPATVSEGKTRDQEVVQFIVNYRFISESGQDNPTQSFTFTNNDGTTVNASFSNWNEFYTKLRKREFDVLTQRYIWSTEDLSNSDVINTNQLSIPIVPNVRVEIRIKSISEVGYPDSIIESGWSDTITISFPTDLLPTRSRQDQIAREAELDNVRLTVQQDLNNQGLDKHLAQSFVSNDNFFGHNTDNIAVTQNSGGAVITLTEKLNQITNSENIEAFKNIILQNSWSNFGSSYSTAQYYRNAGRVYLSGLIRLELSFDNDTDNSDLTKKYPDLIVRSELPTQNVQYATICTLPTGYRPDKIHSFMATTSQGTDITGGGGAFNYPWGRNQRNNMALGFGRIDIFPNGIVRLVTGATGFISLDNVQFRAATDSNTQTDNLSTDALLQLSRLTPGSTGLGI